MDRLINQWIFLNWQRKLIALAAALIVWLLVSHSITETKTLIGLPVRIVNIPEGKTVLGLAPNGLLNRRVTVTLYGGKSGLQRLQAGDLEIILDAKEAPEEWIVNLSKKNLFSLQREIDLQSAVSHLSHQEFVIKLSDLVKEKIAASIEPPQGKAPKGYQFLTVRPQKLNFLVTGPKEQVELLSARGISLQFNLDRIQKEELDALSSSRQGYYEDELAFPVPEEWKKPVLPLQEEALSIEQAPDEPPVEIVFLKKQYIPIGRFLPVRVFYPLEFSQEINPERFPLAYNGSIGPVNHIPVLQKELLAYEVSRLFLDIVKNYLEISIVAEPKSLGEQLKWSLSFVEPQILEDRYVTFLKNRQQGEAERTKTLQKKLEQQWRERFRSYMQKISLYTAKQERLKLSSKIGNGQIRVEER